MSIWTVKHDGRGLGDEVAITAEAHVVGEDLPGYVLLVEVPLQEAPSTVVITAGGIPMTEVTTDPLVGQFKVTYAGSLMGGIVFNGADYGLAILVDYKGRGSNVFARDINQLQSLKFDADGSIPLGGPLQLPDGLEAAPSATFTTDPDTGFYSHAANAIGVTVGGTEIGVWDATGLHVNGALVAATLAGNGAAISGLLASSIVGVLASARLAGSYTGITGLGTVTVGVWNATPLANAYIAAGLDVAKLTVGTALPSNITSSSLTALGVLAALSVAGTATLDIVTSNGMTISNAMAPLVVNNSAAVGLLPIVIGQRGGGTRWNLGVTSADVFALLNAAATVANLTVTDLGALTVRAGVSATTGTFSNTVTVTSGGAAITGTLTATAFSGDGSALTGINATELGSGTIPDARLSANVPLLNAPNLYSAVQVISDTIPTNDALSVSVVGDSVARFELQVDGTMRWSSGGIASDVNLYRSAANTLKTDDNVVVSMALSVIGIITATGGVVGNVTGNATTATSATTAGTVTTAAQPAITSVGTLTTLTVTGTSTLGAVTATNLSVTRAGVPLTLSTTNAAGLNPIIAAQRSGIGKWSLALDATDQFAVLNAAGTTANLTVTDLGAMTVRAGVSATTGTFSGAMTASSFVGDGSAITSLNAVNLTGTIASARIAGVYSLITGLGTLGSVVTGTLDVSGQTSMIGPISFGVVPAALVTLLDSTSTPTVFVGPRIVDAAIHAASMAFIGYGNATTLYGAKAGGTPLVPTATTATNMLNLSTVGYDGTTWAVGGASIKLRAAETWTATAHGGSIQFVTTVIGTLTNVTTTLADTGAWSMPSTLAVTGAVTLASTLAVTGVTTLLGTIVATASDVLHMSFAGNNDINMTGAASVFRILDSTGALVNLSLTQAGALAIRGAATLASTLAVGGVSSFAGIMLTTNSASLPGSIYKHTLDGLVLWGASGSTADLTIYSAASVPILRMSSTGAVTLASTLAVTGNVTYSNFLLGAGAITNSLTAGDMGLGNSKFIRGSNVAGNANFALIGVDGANKVNIDPNSTGTVITASVTVGGVATFGNHIILGAVTAFVPGMIGVYSNYGTILQAKTGVQYDFSIMNAAANLLLMVVPTGADRIAFNCRISAILPTTSTGLVAGDMWRNGNVVNIV
jgi:hypothetical protein